VAVVVVVVEEVATHVEVVIEKFAIVLD